MDNRIRFTENIIDFDNDVGLTGQDHDDYADPGTAVRYDLMRMIILGLLANQSSTEETSEHRPGTIQYDLNEFFYKCSDGNKLDDISKCIKISDKSLHLWSQLISEKIEYFMPSGAFSGVARNNANSISIPKNLQPISKSPNEPLVFINGKLVDPSLTNFNNGCPVCIVLDEVNLEEADTFVVFIKLGAPSTHLSV